jgi:hypothetical protein
LLQRFLRRLADAPSSAFGTLHRDLHDSVLDAVQMWDNAGEMEGEQPDHVFHFERSVSE